MKKVILLGFMILTALVLIACGGEDNTTKDELPEMIDVVIQTPTNIQRNEEVTIETLVTQGDEVVEDADEVKFEIWKAGAEEDEHEMIEGEHQGDGVYSITKTFNQDGIFYVISL